MSEEILKALTQLFAIITKQDGGVSVIERRFVISFFENDLDADTVTEYVALYDQFSGYDKQKSEQPKPQAPVESREKKGRKLTSVRDSVKTLAICKKINKTLTQKQKVVVLIKMFELVASDRNFSAQRMEIIDTVSTVFNIDKKEYKLIESFVIQNSSKTMPNDNILVVNGDASQTEKKHIKTDIDGEIIFLSVKSVDMYFIKFCGSDDEDVVLNGFLMKSNAVYQFSHGSTAKTPSGIALYYSELIRKFITGSTKTKLSFNADKIEFKFKNGHVGLRDINISEGPGQLIGIMGASGAGKTTLLNVLAGIEKPSEGKLLINGIDVNEDSDALEGVIGYVSQDDLLIEELSVYQNLYYNAQLCFADDSEEDIDKKVMDVLSSLGLDQRKDLKVGSVLEKTISGGQRKRLNIALELIREPAVMFVDEPTSGLSSRDSENVIDLLKELSLKGKLIFVVIHQPSSDIYKMFDKMYIMDTGGFPIYYGNPVEAVTYFKRATNQVDSDRGSCPTCNNVNPEQIFNIIEAKVVDEYGEFTNKRKMKPEQWYERYLDKFKIRRRQDVKDLPPKTLNIPGKIKQAFIFATRDTLSKISNRQYMLINLLEAPFLALILAFIIRYNNSPDHSQYIFRFNENLPAYMMMAIVVALFMGLSVSAEEIISDRKILKRESFLNLSWWSYLSSKLSILFTMSAIQTFSFVLVGNSILEIKGMFLSYWLILFSVACFGNLLGLNISALFKSAVTVYILIPILLIPQMVLSGLLFPFDKLNDAISTKGKVPVVADLMASRWAFEAMAVRQFVDNDYEDAYFPYRLKARQANFKNVYLIPELNEKADWVAENYNNKNDSIQKLIDRNLNLIELEIAKVPINADLKNEISSLTSINLDEKGIKNIKLFLEEMKGHYTHVYQEANFQTNKLTQFYENIPEFDLKENMNQYYNESLSDLVTNSVVKKRIIEYEGKFIQQIDPIFNTAHPKSILDYRTHFYSANKHFAGIELDTFSFNLIVIWLMIMMLYVLLYFDLINRALSPFGKETIR